MNEQEILNKFEKDFNSGATVVEGLEIAFNNLPDGFLEKDKTGEILTRLRQLKDTSRDSAVVAVAEELIESIVGAELSKEILTKMSLESHAPLLSQSPELKDILTDAKKYLKYFGV